MKQSPEEVRRKARERMRRYRATTQGSAYVTARNKATTDLIHAHQTEFNRRLQAHLSALLGDR